MNPRQLLLLSPYRPPTSYPVSLSTEEAAAWLNGYAALWHPFALRSALLPPLAASAYDHNDPVPGAVYALASGPSLFLPDDWRKRAADVGAIVFEATADRAATMMALLSAPLGTAAWEREGGEGEEASETRIESLTGDAPLTPTPLPPQSRGEREPSVEIVRLFAGLGYGYLMLDTLFDASNHDRLLDLEAFWNDVTAAVDAALRHDDTAAKASLTEAAMKMLMAREGLAPTGVTLVDLIVRDEATLAQAWPCAFSPARPVTLVASSATLKRLAESHAERFQELKASVPGGVDLAVGVACERDDVLLPIESQLWSLRASRMEMQALFGVAPKLYGRTRSEYHAQLPSWLNAAGFTGMAALNLDGATLPSRYAAVIQWPGSDGKAINAFTKDPLAAHEPATFFNLAHHLHDSTSRESQPTFAIVHTKPPAVGYDDLLALSELAPVFGEWKGLEHLLADSHSAEYVSVPGADEFFLDTLDERVTKREMKNPVSGFAEHFRNRRKIDSAWSLLALHRSLTAPDEPTISLQSQVGYLENKLEFGGATTGLNEIEQACAGKLAERLLARSAPNTLGWLVLNPSGSIRRVGLELAATSPIPIDGPVKASEFADGRAKVVVEVPGLGYAWIPRGVAGTMLPKARIRTAEGTTVRNEYLEAELDPVTGAIKAIRDGKYRITRLGQILAWHPGSRMVAKSVTVTHAGAALGEVTASGEILDADDKVMASFTQRVRAWIGRPALEIKIDLHPVEPIQGYPWHSYLGCRFAWRDDRATLFRGSQGQSSLTGSVRPQSPDYLEIRFGKERSFVFTGGLPFLQRQGGRMLDVILATASETATSFELMVAFDRDYPMPTAQTWPHALPVLPVEVGPPPTGPSGWLANFDLPSLLLTSLKPATPGEGMSRAVEARFVETAGYAGSTELRFARDPSRASVVDLAGDTMQPVAMVGDAIPLDCSANELFTAKMEWQ